MKEADRKRRYERMARRYYAAVYGYLRWLTKDAEEAADLTQETFLQAWRRPPEMRSERELRAWLYRVARNEYLQYRRRKGLNEVGLDKAADAEAWTAGGGETRFDPQMECERAELRGRIAGVLERLPEKYREVLTLRLLGELSIEEAAQVVSAPAGTVKSRYFRGLALLREIMTSEAKNDEMRRDIREAT